MRRFFLVLVALSWTATARAQELPADLALVPASAFGFIHMRTAELWNSPLLKLHRDLLLKAGPKALKTLDERILPPLSKIDRVSVVLLPSPAERPDPEVALLLHVTEPLDAKKLLAGLNEVNKGGVRYYTVPGSQAAVQILDPHTLLVGSPDSPLALVDRPRGAHPFKAALAEAAAGKKVVVAAGNLALIPQPILDKVLNQLPPPLRPLGEARTAQLSIALDKVTALEATLRFPDTTSAKRAHNSLSELRKLGKMFLAKFKQEAEDKLARGGEAIPIFDLEKVSEAIAPVAALGLIKTGEELLDSLPIESKGAVVTVKVNLPAEMQSVALTGVPVMIALLVPAVQKVRGAASRVQGLNNLKQIAQAMLFHHDAYKKFLTAAVCDKNGKRLLSWRVAILPFLEGQEQLYSKFKKNEPWDSEHNKELIPLMPPIYASPAAPAQPGRTHYRVFVGGGAGFEWSKGLGFMDFHPKDGRSNTLMVVEAAESVPWTKPDELVYDPKKPLPKFGNFYGNGTFLAAFFDGHVDTLRDTMPEQTLRRLITRGVE